MRKTKANQKTIEKMIIQPETHDPVVNFINSYKDLIKKANFAYYKDIDILSSEQKDLLSKLHLSLYSNKLKVCSSILRLKAENQNDFSLRKLNDVLSDCINVLERLDHLAYEDFALKNGSDAINQKYNSAFNFIRNNIKQFNKENPNAEINKAVSLSTLYARKLSKVFNAKEKE